MFGTCRYLSYYDEPLDGGKDTPISHHAQLVKQRLSGRGEMRKVSYPRSGNFAEGSQHGTSCDLVERARGVVPLIICQGRPDHVVRHPRTGELFGCCSRGWGARGNWALTLVGARILGVLSYQLQSLDARWTQVIGDLLGTGAPSAAPRQES